MRSGESRNPESVVREIRRKTPVILLLSEKRPLADSHLPADLSPPGPCLSPAKSKRYLLLGVVRFLHTRTSSQSRLAVIRIVG